MEYKLVLLEMLLPRMPFDSVLQLSDNMDAVMESIKENPRENFMTHNTNPILVSYQLIRLSQMIVGRFSRMQTRHKSFQSDMLALVSNVVENLTDSPTKVQGFLKVRNYKGKSLYDLIFEAATYEFMEVRVVEAAIGLSWVGKQNFDGKILETSTAYKLLY